MPRVWSLYYNRDMLTGFPVPLGVEWNGKMARAIRWNPYVSNWPIVLDALRRLWQMGKVSQLKSPFYEPFEKPKNSL
jgi:hypothetical protein